MKRRIMSCLIVCCLLLTVFMPTAGTMAEGAANVEDAAENLQEQVMAEPESTPEPENGGQSDDEQQSGSENEMQKSELRAGLKTDARYVFAGEDTIVLQAAVAGGTAPYSVTLYVNGEQAQEIGNVSGEESVRIEYQPTQGGIALLAVNVTDAEGASASAGVKIPVAVRENENEETWAAMFPRTELSGDWRADLVRIAKSQNGYQESTADFVIGEDGQRRGYSRFAAWNGDAYEDWAASFVSFCLNYAGVPQDGYPRGETPAALADGAQGKGAYQDADYIPGKGDLVFFNYNGGSAAQHVGIVVSVNAQGFTAIEGDVQGKVISVNYIYGEDTVAGFANTTKLMVLAGLTVESETRPAGSSSSKADQPEQLATPSEPAPAVTPSEPEEIIEPEQPAKPEETVVPAIGTGKTTVAGTNIRQKPSTDSARVAAIAEQGAQVEILAQGTVNSETWYAVRYGEYTGYMRGDLLSVKVAQRAVTVTATYDTETLQIGSRVTLTASVEGYDGLEYTCCWQYASADANGNIVGEWQNAQTDALSFTYELTGENLLTAWRAYVTVGE